MAARKIAAEAAIDDALRAARMNREQPERVNDFAPPVVMNLLSNSVAVAG
jgi:hypothetical protein